MRGRLVVDQSMPGKGKLKSRVDGDGDERLLMLCIRSPPLCCLSLSGSNSLLLSVAARSPSLRPLSCFCLRVESQGEFFVLIVYTTPCLLQDTRGD